MLLHPGSVIFREKPGRIDDVLLAGQGTQDPSRLYTPHQLVRHAVTWCPPHLPAWLKVQGEPGM